MSAIEKATFSRDEARSLTDEVKGDAERLWRKLVELHEGNAHTVLGHASWHAYCAAEFGMNQAQAYRVLHAGEVLSIIQLDNELPALTNESQARELAPLRKQPEKMRKVWASVVESNPTPTAADIRAAVVEVKPDFKPGTKNNVKAVATPSPVVALRALYDATRATSIEEVIDWRGNSRQLVAQWASVQSYFARAFAAREETIPQVLEGEIVGH